MTIHAPSLQHAVAIVRAAVKSCAAQHAYRLPTVAALARQAEVSPVTMCKAIALLKAEGVLCARQGRWVEIAGAVKPEESPTATGVRAERWIQVHDAVRNDIRTGALRCGVPLPSPKELSRRFGACYRTVRKALVRLQRSGLIVPYKKTFMIPALMAPSSHGTVVLIAAGDCGGALRPFTPRTQELLRTLETECSRAGANLEIMTYAPAAGILYNQGRPLSAGALASARFNALGFMVWTMSLEPHHSHDLITRILPRGLPLSVLDESGVFRLPRGADPVRVKHFTMANSATAGEQAGRFLRNLGHEQVAFISPFHAGEWSRNRLDGLKAAFADSAAPDSVRAFTYDGPSRLAEYAAQARSIHAMIDAMPFDAASAPQKSATRVQTAMRELHKGVAGLEQESIREKTGALLELALQAGDCTAWVAANDDIALEALAFLAQRGKQVPRDVSVFGFDDSLAAFLKRVTSYNFNGQAVLHAMLAHILTPSAAARGKRANPASVEIDGFIARRATVAAVR